jgi:K+/H+ antiporter YhaU regulatory subunit KhtT
VNPKLDLGCAKWCQYAKECLGEIGSQENQTFSNKLIECLRDIAGSDQRIIRLSLEILSYAEKIQFEEGGNPLIVKASAILSQIRKKPSLLINSESGTATITAVNDDAVRDILSNHGLENEIISHISRILNTSQRKSHENSIEFDIISDACCLAELQHQLDAGGQALSKSSWKTRTGQRLATEIINRSDGNDDKEI